MKENIKKMAQDALNCIDKFEYGKTETPAAGERNDPLRIAAGLSRYFTSIPVKEYAGENLFGRFRLHYCLYPGDLYVRNGHVHYNEYWDKLCSRRPRPLFYWGWTHIVLDFSYILQNGLDGYIAEIDALPKKNRLQRAMKVTLLALEEMFARFARSCKNEVLAAILKKVPAKPAETFYEAVQSVWSVFQLVPDSLGRIDQYLYPYYRRGLAEGSLTRERAAELLEELFVKVYESQMNNTALPISGHNHLVVGGYLEDGTTSGSCSAKAMRTYLPFGKRACAKIWRQSHLNTKNMPPPSQRISTCSIPLYACRAFAAAEALRTEAPNITD